LNPTPAQLRWTGLFLVAGALLVVGAVVFLMGSRLSRDVLPLSCEVRGESVSGLSTGGKVELRGIEVGRVVSMEFDPEDPERILVGIEVDPKAPVYKDAWATLEIFGITGLKYLELSPGTPSTGRPEPGTILPTRPSLTTGLLNAMDTIARSSVRVLENLDALTSRDRRGQIDSIVADLRRTSADFATMAGNLKDARLDSQVTSIARQVTKAVHNIDSALGASKPAQSMARIDTAAGAMANVARRADLMLGRSQSDIYRSLEDLRSTMRNLADFSQTIRDNPAAVLRSGDKGDE